MKQNTSFSAQDPERERQIRSIRNGLIPLLFIFLMLAVVLFSSVDLPPALWRTKEITIVEVQYKAGFGSTGSSHRPWNGVLRQAKVYVIEDQDGVRYRLDSNQISGRDGGASNIFEVLQEGAACTVVYSPRLGLRQVKGLLRGETAHLDPAAQAHLWYTQVPFYVILLLALAGSVWAIVHHIRKGLEILRIVEYQARVRAEKEEKAAGNG